MMNEKFVNNRSINVLVMENEQIVRKIFSGVHMAEFIATDYLVNSLLFHAYKQKYMEFTIGPESSPQLKNILLTTCDNGYCIGEYLGELSSQFPDHEVEIHFSTRKVNHCKTFRI